MQLFSFTHRTQPAINLSSIAILLYCGAAYGMSTSPITEDKAANAIDLTPHLVTILAAAPAVATISINSSINTNSNSNTNTAKIAHQKAIKKNNICRELRGSYLQRLDSQRVAKNQAIDDGVSSFQQRIYRTRVGGLTRPLIRDHAVNHC